MAFGLITFTLYHEQNVFSLINLARFIILPLKQSVIHIKPFEWCNLYLNELDPAMLLTDPPYLCFTAYKADLSDTGFTSFKLA